MRSEMGNRILLRCPEHGIEDVAVYDLPLIDLAARVRVIFACGCEEEVAVSLLGHVEEALEQAMRAVVEHFGVPSV